MKRRPGTLAFAVIAMVLGACGGSSRTPAPTGSLAARAELRVLIEDLFGADGFVYGVHDDRGHPMDTVKIIQVEETGEFAGVYHSWLEDPGVFEVHLATSADLLT